ncbi:MAG TPA: hypothetical protein VMI92_06470 [Steroidobacteraceae bacterium]|nr:hypothetical protein [Steroidobacteraceae bacterium]
MSGAARPAQSRVIALRFKAWLLAMVAMLAVFALYVMPRLKVETDILALLPVAADDRASNSAIDHFSQALAAKIVLLVGAPELEQARRAAQRFAATLAASHAFASVTLEQGAYTQETLRLYAAHRGYLLSAHQLRLLQSGQQAQLQQEAVRAAFTPTGLMRAVSFSDDPLGLANDYLLQQLPGTGAAQLDGRMLVIPGDTQSYVLITADLAGSPFATQVEDDAGAALAKAQAAAAAAIAPATLDVVMSGTVQHAAAARNRANNELSVFGTLETASVVLLLVTIFSGVRPLLLGALTTALAFTAGLCATFFVFGTVHVLALVFGSSLIGGVIDYSIHFFADRFRGDPDWTPASAVEHVGGAVLLGLVTTLLGYVVLLLVPFPGLRQIALFCVAGLAVGCATVLCAYPVLYRAPRRRAAWGPRLGEWLARVFSEWRWNGLRAGVAVLLLLAALAGLRALLVQDDVRALQSSPPQLVAAEKRVAALLRTGTDSRYFLVQATTPEGLLETESTLTGRLDTLKAVGKLGSYTALSRAVPPLIQQQQAHALLESKVLAPDGILPAVLRQLGFPPAAVAERTRAFAAGSTPLQVDDWLASDASRPYRELWLGRLGGRYASIVTLANVSDVPALDATAAAVPGVRLIDRVQTVTDVLYSYRRAMSWLLGVVYVIAMALLCFKFGWREAPLLLLPSALASAVTLGLFGWFGVPVNLFTLLALWLVLGLGVDYGIFLRHGRTALPTAVLSVSLSAITTLLAFGMLAASSTPFIRSIGLTLLFAISLSWLFAMLSCLTLERIHE